MADARLRELERRWRDSGELSDEAAYLAERVRDGELAEERLRLAAYLGHAAAGACVGRPLTRLEELETWVEAHGHSGRLRELLDWLADWRRATRAQLGCLIRAADDARDGWSALGLEGPSPLEVWVHGLALWGSDPVARAVAALGRQALSLLAATEVHERAVLVLDRLDAWIFCPCPDHERALRDAEPRELSLPGQGAAADAAEAVRVATEVIECVDVRSSVRVASELLELLPAEPERDEERRAAVAAQLLPWALATRPAAPVIPALAHDRDGARRLLDATEGGRVERSSLSLLAHVGFGPARLALDTPGSIAQDDLEAWVRAFAAWGKVPLVRAALALASSAVWSEVRPRGLALLARPDPRLMAIEAGARTAGEPSRQAAPGARIVDALGSAEGWLRAPHDLRAAAGCDEAASALEPLADAGGASAAATRAVWAAARAAAAPDVPTWAAVDALLAAREALRARAHARGEEAQPLDIDRHLRRAVRARTIADILAECDDLAAGEIAPAAAAGR